MAREPAPMPPSAGAALPPRPPISSDFFPAFSDQELGRRHATVRDAMRSRGLDCLVIHGFHHYNGNDVGQTNIVWLANFANVVQTYVVFPLETEPTLVVGLQFHVQVARKLSYIRRIVADPGLAGGMVQAVRGLEPAPVRIGIVGYVQGLTLPHEHRLMLERAFPGSTFEDVTAWFQRLRLVLSAEERATMRRAAGLSDRIHERVFRATRPGVSHAEVCRVIGVEALAAGGHWALSHVGSTPMADPEAYYPDFYATDEPFRVGDVCQTELAIGYGNYMVKTTTTYFLGEPTEEYRRLFATAVEIQNRCIEGLRPGMTGRDVDRFTEPAVAAGFALSQPVVGGYSTYNTAPWSGAIPGTPLEAFCRPSEAFVFEPGQSLFVIGTPHVPGTRRGVWVGQTCLVTERGLERLGSYPVEELRVIPG